MSDDYYWLLPYAKKLERFFASDIQEAMKADDIYFHIGTIVRAIQYWIEIGRIITVDTPYFTHSGMQKVNKYGYVKE